MRQKFKAFTNFMLYFRFYLKKKGGDDLARNFKKQVDRNLVVTEVRARRFFEPMTEIRKKQKISARKKMLKRLYMLRRYESRL